MAKKLKKKITAKADQENKTISQQPSKKETHRQYSSLPGKQREFSVKSLCIILAVISVVLYANTLLNSYVLDDNNVIKNNTIVTKGIPAIPEIFSTPYRWGYFHTSNDQYRPLSLAMFAVEYQVFGGTPAPGHFINIILFAACVVLLFLFLNKLFERKKTAVAFIASLLFAIHPIHTEVVANIKSSDELLCFCFAFLSLNIFIKYIETGKIYQLLFGSVCFFLSLLSKETVITFLAIIPLIFFFYKNENKKRSIYITVGAIAMTALFLMIRYIVLSVYDAGHTAQFDFLDNMLVNAPSAASRLATEIYILGNYVKLLIVPYPLISDYSYHSIPFVGFDSAWVLISLAAYSFLLVFSISGLINKTKNLFVFAILFFLITILLFSNIFFLIGTPMAERLLFFPSVGFCLLVALVIDKWIIGTSGLNAPILTNTKAWVALAPVFVIFSSMTIARNNDWKSNYTLFKTDLTKSPDDCRLYFNLAVEIDGERYEAVTDSEKKHEMDLESIGYLRHALDIYPDFPDAHLQLGWVYDREHMPDSAILHYKRSLELSPYNSNANYYLGFLYSAMGNYPESVTLLKKALAFYKTYKIGLYSTYKLTYSGLAYTYIQTKQYDSAIISANELLAIDPAFFDAQMEVATAFFMKQNYDSAEAHYKSALKLNPVSVEAINNLGVAYVYAKKFPQAIKEFDKTITIDKNNTKAYDMLGNCYFSMQQYPQAIEAFRKVLMLDPQNRGMNLNIAKSYEQMGLTDSAKKYQITLN